MLKIKNLTKTINNHTILNDISLNIKQGEIALLLGPSGSGKTTLLKILNHLETITSGTIELNGTSLTSMNSAARPVGLVFQHFNLFENLNVIENITIVLEKVIKLSYDTAEERALELLEKFNLHTHAYQAISQLSGGQKQRLAIARTLSLSPQVICFDEPTSALDPSLTNYVADIIQELAAQGYIIIVTTHDQGLMEKLHSHIYLMEKGTITTDIDSQEFFRNKDMYPTINNFIQGM